MFILSSMWVANDSSGTLGLFKTEDVSFVRCLVSCKKIVSPLWHTEWSVRESLEKCDKGPLELLKAQRRGAAAGLLGKAKDKRYKITLQWRSQKQELPLCVQ